MSIEELASHILLESKKGHAAEPMDKTYLGRIERGERPYNEAILTQAAAALECKVPDLFVHPAGHIGGQLSRLPVPEKRNRVDFKRSAPDPFPPGVTPVEEVNMRLGMGAGGLGDEINQDVEGGYIISKDAVLATWGVPTPYLSEMGIHARGGVYLFRVQGDSMQRPDGAGLHSGDLVMADTSDRTPSPPGIFALWDGLGTVVKRIEYIMGSEPARINIISDNPQHQTIERTLEEVNIIGRCVWYGRRL